MNNLITKNLSKEQLDIFELLRKDREENAKVLEKPSMGGVKKSVIEKYSEHAHFIYELLQNADDTEATNVRFILDKSGLFFAHNGEINFFISHPHTEDADKKTGKLGHINSITSIGNTTKLESQIGKFGVGFKAVFEYTNTPHVYDPPFLFKIERFIIPVLLETDQPNRVDGETLFHFPFDLENKKDTAYKEINEKLKNLDNSLLFLRHLSKIEWKNTEGESGLYSRKSESKITSLLTKVNGNEFKHKFLIFEKKVKDQDQFEHTINIAYKYDPEGEKISSDHKFPAYCFFRTRESTELKFIVHAPFLLTDSREGIKENAWNDFLIKELAELAGDSLPEIRDMGLLDVGFFNVLPITKDDFKDSKFQPIYNAVLKKLNSDKKLLPANDGGYISAKQAFLARGKDLIDLLNPKQLSWLFGKEDCQWLNSNITQDKAHELRKYLIEDLKIQEITPEKFANQFTEEFMKELDDEWVIRFYTFLKDQKALWRKKDWNPEEPLRKKPFIRLEDNTHVVPFDDSGKPRVYLPSNFGSSFPTVKKCIAENKEAKEFLKDHLKLNEPDKFDEVIAFVLPKYGKDDIKVSIEENFIDMKKILQARESDSETKKADLMKRLQVTPFLLVYNEATGKRLYKKPDEIYFSKTYTGNDDLEIYFQNYTEAFFLANTYKDLDSNIEKICRFFSYLGIDDKPRRIKIESQLSSEEMEALRGKGGCTRDCESYDFDIDGLEYFLDNNLTSKSALYLWKFLLERLKDLKTSEHDPFFQGRYCWSYYSERHKPFDAKFLKTLQRSAWLPDMHGKFHKPADIFLSDLLKGFDKERIEAKVLEKKLDFKKDNIHQLLSQLPEWERRRIELAKTISLEKLEKLAAEEAEEKEGKQFPVQPVHDEERRKLKAIENYKKSPKKEYEKRNRSVRTSHDPKDKRTFLREWYQDNEGRVVCQICTKQSFFKNRQNEYYFEVTEIVDDEMEYDTNNLALCPLCAAKYQKGERTEDVKIKERLYELYLKRKTMQRFVITIDLCGEQKQIQFVEKHLVDLVPIFEKTQ